MSHISLLWGDIMRNRKREQIKNLPYPELTKKNLR